MKRALLIYRDAERVPPYRDALLAAGIEPVLVEAGSPVSLDAVDGLLLMGGGDVDPELYGEARHPETEAPDPELDAAEMAALGEALDRDLPVLAICRGAQLMNVHHGGTLTQHLDPPEHHRRREGDRSLPVHAVAIQDNTLLSSIAERDTWHVNSRHHQAINRLGAGLRISATDPADGIIEAIERPDRSFVLAVQWHPENQIRRDDAQLDLFRRFAKAMGPTR